MSFDREALKDPSWWHWALTIPLLAAHFAGVPWALAYAAILCAFMASYYLPIVASLRPFPVQIRLAYLVLLAAGTLPAMGWIHITLLLGTSVTVLAGYCPLARTLMLMPWNRREPLTRRLAHHAFLQTPTHGGIFRLFLLPTQNAPSGQGESCSLHSSPALEVHITSVSPR